MRSSFVNRLLVAIALTLGCSPLVAHILLMLGLGIAFGAANPEGFRVYDNPVALEIWLGCAAFAVIVTWATKGPLRKQWTQAEPWRTNDPAG